MATENIQSIGNFTDGKYATGRRKKSIAKVWLKKGSGNISVSYTHLTLPTICSV